MSAAMLLGMECDFGQGWFFGAPATLQEWLLGESKPGSVPV